MRRDMDLIRTILLNVEDHPLVLSTDSYNPTWTTQELLYHAKLIDQAGLAEVAFIKKDDTVACACIGELTWQGCDFIDTVRSETLWAKVKTTIATSLGSASFNVLTQVASRLALDQLS